MAERDSGGEPRRPLRRVSESGGHRLSNPQLLDDAALRGRLSESAGKKHLEHFNCQIQFAEVASWIAFRCTA
jgi:hypothetical protein